MTRCAPGSSHADNSRSAKADGCRSSAPQASLDLAAKRKFLASGDKTNPDCAD